MFYIIYPERRYVSRSQIDSWYFDACENGKIAEEYLNAPDTETKAHALMDSGMITLAEER